MTYQLKRDIWASLLEAKKVLNDMGIESDAEISMAKQWLDTAGVTKFVYGDQIRPLKNGLPSYQEWSTASGDLVRTIDRHLAMMRDESYFDDRQREYLMWLSPQMG